MVLVNRVRFLTDFVWNQNLHLKVFFIDSKNSVHFVVIKASIKFIGVKLLFLASMSKLIK